MYIDSLSLPFFHFDASIQWMCELVAIVLVRATQHSQSYPRPICLSSDNNVCTKYESGPEKEITNPFLRQSRHFSVALAQAWQAAIRFNGQNSRFVKNIKKRIYVEKLASDSHYTHSSNGECISSCKKKLLAFSTVFLLNCHFVWMRLPSPISWLVWHLLVTLTVTYVMFFFSFIVVKMLLFTRNFTYVQQNQKENAVNRKRKNERKKPGI